MITRLNGNLTGCLAGLALSALALSFVPGEAAAQATRNYIWAAGSSTVFPYSTRAAEYYARKTGNKAPKIEALGTGGGFKLFCSGVGPGTPDMANASRRMKASEYDACMSKGVKEILELQIGFDGIVIANAKGGATYNFKLEHMYLALSKDVLRRGEFVKNPYKNWKEIGTGLASNRILVYGPPPTSGTRDAWNELGMEAGAARFPVLKALKDKDEKKFKALSTTAREDGAWVDSGENDNAIVATLTKTPGAMGVFGYSFLEENMDKVKAATVDGVAPTAENIASGAYPLSRSLYVYVKKAHIGVIPGLKEFVTELLSDAATGRGGYLRDRGLISLPQDRHAAQKAEFRALKIMSRPDH